MKRAIFGRAQGFFNKVGSRSLRSPGKRLDKVEESMAAALKKKCKKGEEATQKLVAPSWAAACARRSFATRSKRRPSTRCGSAASPAATRSSSRGRARSMELVKDENQLCYLKEQLTKLQDMTEQTWKDAAESWAALLSLRSQIQVERGQAVLECMCADEKVLKAIGAAVQLRKSVGRSPTTL